MHKRYFIAVSLLAALLSCARAPERVNETPAATQVASLPDDPCQILSSERVTAITGLQIVSVNRVPSLEKIIEAQEENREPDPGTICIYETRSEAEAIMVMVPRRSDRQADRYWKARTKYFETFPGSAQHVEGIGVDAWFSAGTALNVLVHGGEHFTIATRMAHPRSREFVVILAKAVVEQH